MYHSYCPQCKVEYYESPHNDECDWCVPEVKLIEVPRDQLEIPLNVVLGIV